MDVKDIVLKAISEKKGNRILSYDTRMMTPYMDTMIIASSDNVRQNAALAQNIKDRLFEAGYTGFWNIEGNKDSHWLLVDLRDVVVHLFVKDERNLYQLDRLYGECPVEEYDL